MSKYFTQASFLLLAAAMAFSVFSCSLLGLYLVAGVGIRLPFKEAIALAATFVILVLAVNSLPIFGRIFAKLENVKGLWSIAVLLGLALRLTIWLISGPEIQINDGEHYLELARKLYMNQPYLLDGYAFWPPGTPLIYSMFMHILGEPAWISVIVNSAFFVSAAYSIRVICRHLGFSDREAGITVAVMACWPELVFPISQVSKETLLVGMLPAVLALVLSQRWWAALIAGSITGMTILTQPSLMLLPLFLAGVMLALKVTPRTIILNMALLCAGAALVIAPWTYRNYQIFGQFVPVSTNSGLVLHAGNQSAMVKPMGEVGGFLAPPLPATPIENDLELSKWHKEEAIRFILGNKREFAQLVWTRLVITMGDDSDSAYRSFRLTNKVSNNMYLASKAISNAYWMLIAAIGAASLWKLRKQDGAKALMPLIVLAASGTLYLMAVHGMAEGGGRHHMAWSWLYALVSIAAVRRLMQIPPVLTTRVVSRDSTLIN